MPIMVLVHIPASYHATKERAQANPALVVPIMEASRKHGCKVHGQLIGDGKFVSLDEWPNYEAYAAFKADADEALARWHREAGYTPTDEQVWEFDPAPPVA